MSRYGYLYFRSVTAANGADVVLAAGERIQFRGRGAARPGHAADPDPVPGQSQQSDRKPARPGGAAAAARRLARGYPARPRRRLCGICDGGRLRSRRLAGRGGVQHGHAAQLLQDPWAGEPAHRLGLFPGRDRGDPESHPPSQWRDGAEHRGCFRRHPRPRPCRGGAQRQCRASRPGLGPARSTRPRALAEPLQFHAPALRQRGDRGSWSFSI